MNNENYKKELNLIKADEKWKAQMKAKMYAETNNKVEAKEIKDRNGNFKRYALGSLCICLIVSGILVYHYFNSISTDENKLPILDNNEQEEDQNKEELQILNLNEDDFFVGGMGFEGYELYDASELIHNNPYDVNKGTKTLPVYQNLNISGRFGMYEIARYTRKEEIEILEHYASVMNIKEYRIDELEEETLLISDICDIRIYSKDGIIIEFSEKAIDDNMLVYTKDDTKKDVIERIEQLIKHPRLKEVFDFSQANIDVQRRYGFYDIDQTYRPSWEIKVSNGKGSQTNKLVNNQLNAIDISASEDGYLSKIAIEFKNTKQKIGNYPIISLEEAKQQLIKGHYITSSWFQGDIEHISYVEMVYFKNNSLDYFMPFYKFYMPLKDQDMVIKHDDRLVTYVAYYVPAIHSDYLGGISLKQPFE